MSCRRSATAGASSATTTPITAVRGSSCPRAAERIWATAWWGWETRRRREPGNDWIVVALGAAGTVERLEIDTAHFKGNYPDRASVEGILLAGGGDESGLLGDGAEWRCVMAEEKLEMDKIHTFEGDRVRDIGPVTHLRLSIYPDGGVSRFRAFGKPAGD